MASLIFLIGYMGCGKTTLGHALERAARVRFVDLDEAIEQQAGASTSEIFATEGEAAFRAMETRQLQSLIAQADNGSCADDALVIACGGGTPCQDGNMSLMKAHGEVVLLEADRPILLRRLWEGRAKRPLLAALDRDEMARYVDQHLSQRQPYYRQASSRFDSSRLDTVDQIAESVALFIKQYKLTPRQ